MRALGEAATQLPWLSPCAASLAALARAPAAAWLAVRRDPGAVLLIVRQTAPSLTSPALSFFPSLLRDPAILEGSLRFLAPVPGARGPESACFVDWNQPAVRPVYEASLSYAQLAFRLAAETGRCDPDNAWVAGLLAPLGWLAVCATAPTGAAACLEDPDLPRHPVRVQQSRWGLDQAGIARRLGRHWRLPAWLAAVVGHVGLPVEFAAPLGADPNLLRVVQLAVSLAQQRGARLHLPVGTGPDENAAALGLSAAAVAPESGWQKAENGPPGLSGAAGASPSEPLVWRAPTDVPLLRDLLELAADHLRARDVLALEQRDRDFDQLHYAFQQQCRGEAARLQEQKLAALAEVAAGAGHEINNPLAVISGQAQYLLGHLQAESQRLRAEGNLEEEDSPLPSAFWPLPPGTERALRTIVGQAQRIHQLLNELMQFARPPRPQKQLVDAPRLVREVVTSLAGLAVERRVRLLGPEGETPGLSLYADPRQIRTALTCLLRNAIEAAPADGWAGVRLETPSPERLELVVEDSGSGPATSQCEHLFDPFYSGRHAGRGRGLGLSTAWRLVREHGGEVRYEGVPKGPTRFVISLPRETSNNGAAA
jgi:signal transduction histidine kinase